MGNSNYYIYGTIDDMDGTPVECYFNTVNTIDSLEREDGYSVDRYIAIIVTSDEKAVLAELTITDKTVLSNGTLDVEDPFSTAREISIAEALELWKD